MNSQNKRRMIHLAGAFLCLVAIIVAAGGDGLKSEIAILLGIIGLLGNVYGVFRPNTWMR